MQFDEQTMSTLIELIATRNLFVHNRGIVNDIYLQQVSNSNFMLGDLRIANRKLSEECLQQFANAVDNIDNVAIAKFNLNVVPVFSEILGCSPNDEQSDKLKELFDE
jgi:hypothetical protein